MFINNFDPVAFNILSLEIRWYSLSYILELFWLAILQKNIDKDDLQTLFDDYIFYLILGIIFGGRLGYVLIYNFNYYLSNPKEIL